MGSNTLQDSYDEYSAFAGCLLTLLCQALCSGLWSYLSHSELATVSRVGTVIIPTLETVKLRFGSEIMRLGFEEEFSWLCR